MPKVAFYTRISTDETHQKDSLGAQEERLEAFCKSQFGADWTLFKVYKDAASGTHLNRPGLREMLADAQMGAFDTLLVFRVDRLSRKVRELAQLVDELTGHDIALKSITEPFDTTNAAGKMMLQMLGVFAEFEHATIVERTKVGMEKKAKGGEFVGGVVPYGYRLDPDRGLLPNPNEVTLVARIFKMYVVERLGAQSVCVTLNDAGERKRTGKPWDRRVILLILQNPIYVGKLQWRGVVHEGKHESIVPQQLFDRAQRILQERREDLKGRQWHNKDERMLTGVIRCRSCRSRMFGGGGKKNGTYIPYYVCSKRLGRQECDQDYIRADRIESTIINDIKTIFRDEALIEQIWEKVNKKLAAERPTVDTQIARIETQRKDVQTRLDRYFEAFETGQMSPDLCNEKVEALTIRLRQLDGEKTALDGRQELPVMDRSKLADLIDKFEDVLASGTKPQKKHLVGLLVQKVQVHNRDKIEVWYRVPEPQRFEHWNNWLPRLDSNRSPLRLTTRLPRPKH